VGIVDGVDDVGDTIACVEAAAALERHAIVALVRAE